MHKSSKNTGDKNKTVIYVDESRNLKILQALSENFVMTGFPIKVASRNKKKYAWMNESGILKTNIDFCKFIVDFVAYEMPEMHESFNPIRAGVVGAIIMSTIQQIGEFSDRCKFVLDESIDSFMGMEDKIIEDGVTERKSLTAKEAIEEITRIYDVDLGFDGDGLRLFNKNNEDTQTFGGVTPFLAVSAIIQKKIGYLEPEAKLILAVTKKLYEIAEAKDEKPYIMPPEEWAKEKDGMVKIDFSKLIRDSLL